jgi:hypothetical protein
LCGRDSGPGGQNQGGQEGRRKLQHVSLLKV